MDERVFVYAAGGYYYPGKNLRALQDEMRGYLDLGYSVVKMKIGGAPLDEDLRRIEAVLRSSGPGERWRWTRMAASTSPPRSPTPTRSRPYDLLWYEEAGRPARLRIQAALAQHYAPPHGDGENLFSMQDARNLLRYGGMRPDRDILQFDSVLSYGLVEYLRTLAMLREYGWSPAR